MVQLISMIRSRLPLKQVFYNIKLSWWNPRLEVHLWKYKLKIKDVSWKEGRKCPMKTGLPMLLAEYLHVKMKPRISPPWISCHLEVKWKWNILCVCVYVFVIQIRSILFFVSCVLCLPEWLLVISAEGPMRIGTWWVKLFDFCCAECVCLWSVISQKDTFLLNSRTDCAAEGVLLS